MSEGIEKVKACHRLATALLQAAGPPYAVIGGNAVAAWNSRVDDSVVRNTRDVDLLVRRSDMDAIITMKLASYRRIDRVHLLDMVKIGVLDESWLPRVPISLRDRL